MSNANGKLCTCGRPSLLFYATTQAFIKAIAITYTVDGSYHIIQLILTDQPNSYKNTIYIYILLYIIIYIKDTVVIHNLCAVNQ